MKKLLFTLLFIPTLLQAAPEERWYQVELILFANNSSDYHQSELWPIDYTEPQLEDSRELTRAPRKVKNKDLLENLQAFSLLPVEQLKLGGAAKRIKRAPDMELVLHLGWLQPGLSEDKAVAVHVYDQMLQQINRSTSGKQAKSTGNEIEAKEIELPKLDGNLRLILSRYLHLESDLIWRDPLTTEELALRSALPVMEDPNASFEEDSAEFSGEPTGEDAAIEEEMNTLSAASESESQLQQNDSGEESAEENETSLITHHVYRMKQSRRMRSNETHYMDHPRFGIVARVTPYESEQPEAKPTNN